MDYFTQLLKDQIEGLKAHAALVGAGIPSDQALRITHGDAAAQKVQDDLMTIAMKEEIKKLKK